MRTRVAAVLLLLLALLAGPLAGSASAGGSSFAEWADRERAAAGRAPYAVRADLTEVATRHARRMAARGDIWHNPELAREVGGWLVVGENVGVGDTERAVHDALLRSPAHRANLLSAEYTEIGVGVATGADGRFYVVQVFRRPAGAPVARRAPRPAPVLAARARPAPRPVVAASPPAGALPRAVAFTRLLEALAAAA